MRVRGWCPSSMAVVALVVVLAVLGSVHSTAGNVAAKVKDDGNLKASLSQTYSSVSSQCPDFVPGELLVGFQPGVTRERADEIASAVGAAVTALVLDVGSGPVYNMRVPVGQELAFIPLFEFFLDVRYAQPNFIIIIFIPTVAVVDGCPVPPPPDADGDSRPDVLDPCPTDTDCDDDTVLDGVDNCVTVPNGPREADMSGVGNQTDTDADGVGDACDSCPILAFAAQLDTDGDGKGDACDTDDDNDGFTDTVEASVGTDPLLACGPSAWPPDFNDDSRVNLADVFLFRPHFATADGGPDYDPRFDLNADGRINLGDVFILRQYFATQCGP